MELGGGGICQYFVLAHHLLGGRGKFAEARIAIAKYMEENAEEFVGFVDGWELWEPNSTGRTLVEFTADLKKGYHGTNEGAPVWGNNATLYAAYKVYDRPFTIVNHMPGGTTNIPADDQLTGDEGERVFIAHLPEQHYQGTRLLNVGGGHGDNGAPTQQRGGTRTPRAPREFPKGTRVYAEVRKEDPAEVEHEGRGTVTTAHHDGSSAVTFDAKEHEKRAVVYTHIPDEHLRLLGKNEDDENEGDEDDAEDEGDEDEDEALLPKAAKQQKTGAGAGDGDGA